MEWTWEAIAGFVAAGIVFGAAIFAYVQLREMKRRRNADVVVEIYRELRNREAIETLRFIYRVEPEEVEHLPDQQRLDIERMCDRFEMLGILVCEGSIAESLALELILGSPLRCWRQLCPYIQRRRGPPGRGHYARYFEDYARRSIKYQIKNEPRDWWSRFEGDETTLIEQLQDGLLTTRQLSRAYSKRAVRSVYKWSLGPKDSFGTAAAYWCKALKQTYESLFRAKKRLSRSRNAPVKPVQ